MTETTDQPGGSETKPEPLFTFAIVTDTHIRPPGGDESSPFPVNDLANDRARYAAHAIAHCKPAFTIHLGDMVHPLPHLPTFAPACDAAHAILEPLKPNLHFVPGNHDIGDKPMMGSPAGPSDADSIAIYERHFGPGHYSFDHNGLHVVVMNSSLVNSGSEPERAQRDWLEQDLAEHADGRTFLFSHYPPIIDTEDETTHYDNYDEPGRSWLLNLVRKHKVEAVFSGHVHQFFYNRVGETRLYCLPPTSFTRQDYAELYHVAPAPEFGRNDAGKFSFALVDIYADGHGLRVIPTEGRELAEGVDLELPPVVAATNGDAPFTVHLRHGWGRAWDLPYNGPMEEYLRKRARNDYTLARLWQMGIAHVRARVGGLLDPDYGRRAQAFHAAGIRFTLFCAGVPGAETWTRTNEHAGLIDAVEFISSDAELADLEPGLAAISSENSFPIFVGKFHSSAHEPRSGSKFAHSVSFGFKWEEREEVAAALKRIDRSGAVAGLAFCKSFGKRVWGMHLAA